MFFNVTGCPRKCPGCHTPELQTEAGETLDSDTVKSIVRYHAITEKEPITTILFFGGDHDPEFISLLEEVWEEYYMQFSLALYTGVETKEEVSPYLRRYLRYLKVGSYKESLGPITSNTTNQRLWDLSKNLDITHKFWKTNI